MNSSKLEEGRLKRLIAFVWVSLFAGEALAAPMGTVHRNALACTNEANYQEAFDAIDADDMKWLSEIPGCFNVEPGARVDIIEVGMFGPSKVRLMRPDGGRPVELYINQEAIELDE